MPRENKLINIMSTTVSSISSMCSRVSMHFKFSTFVHELLVISVMSNQFLKGEFSNLIFDGVWSMQKNEKVIRSTEGCLL